MACNGDFNNDSSQTSNNCKSNNPWRYDKNIESDPDNCAKIVHLLLDQLEAFQWENRDIFGIHMAMEEAVMNAIRHGNKCDVEKEVHVLIEICDRKFYSKITDQGPGFDPGDLPDPTLEENLEKTSGRGVMLMKSFVDVVTYNECGNSVELAKVKSD
jgi:serine/threonine-protein kinase RsbW